jgi:hypothetical protein
MGYLLNYKNWRALHESLDSGSTEFTKPGAIESGGRIATEWSVGISDDDSFEKLKTFQGELMKKFDGSIVDTSGDPPDNVGRALATAILAAVYTSLDAGTRPKTFADFIKWSKDDANWASLAISYGEAEKIDWFGNYTEKYGAWASVRGTLDTNTTSVYGWQDENRDKLKTQPLRLLIKYMNAFNLTNAAAGSWAQYDYSKSLDDKNAFQPSKTPIVVKNNILLYSVKEITETAGSKTTTTEMVGGKSAQQGGTEIMFEKGSSTVDTDKKVIDASHPKVREVGDQILGYLGKNGVIQSMELISSASPEWAGGETMANYQGKVTNGTGAPAAGTDFAAKNAALAYQRGLTFQKALEAYLGAAVKANSIKVGWKISTDNPGNGRNVTYNVVTKAENPTEVVRTSFAAAKETNVNLAGTGKFNKYTVTWKIPKAFTSKESQDAELSAKELADLYSTLKAGEEILVYDKTGKEAKIKITEIIDDKPSFTKKDDSKITIELEKKDGVTSFKGLTAATKAARLAEKGKGVIKNVTKKPDEDNL